MTTLCLMINNPIPPKLIVCRNDIPDDFFVNGKFNEDKYIFEIRFPEDPDEFGNVWFEMPSTIALFNTDNRMLDWWAHQLEIGDNVKQIRYKYK